MASGFRVEVTGQGSVVKGLEEMNPGLNRKITNPAMVESALLVLRIAAQGKIVRGGAKGASPRAGVLTSRTGRLRSSLSLKSGGVDKSRLPRNISVGSNVKYAGVHEFGGTVRTGASRVRAHTRTNAFGKNVAPFKVPAHSRKAHSKKYPKRAYLAPALDQASFKFPDIFLKHWNKAIS